MGERHQPAQYRIRVRGELDQRWADWFNGLTMRIERTGSGLPVTVLTGPISDQAAMQGILNKLIELNLELLGLELVEPGSEGRAGGDTA